MNSFIRSYILGYVILENWNRKRTRHFMFYIAIDAELDRFSYSRIISTECWFGLLSIVSYYIVIYFLISFTSQY